ncbi:MAG: hypothetical protein KDB27_30875 [Planctomycetales bacterium]|nr:hypothetical protein [Planctomycetales bacterium]
MSDLLDPNKIALRHRNIPGAQLLGWKNVAIAVYSVKVRAVLMRQKPVAPIDEFLLRALNARINHIQDLSSFLGLDAITVESHLADLHRSELIAIAKEPQPSDLGVKVELTPRGKDIAASLKTNEIVEENIPVWFHGFLRKPIPYRRGELLNNRECQEEELVQIPAMPARKPELDEFQLADLVPIVREYFERAKSNSQNPELVGLKSVSKEGGLLYQPAVMLVYQMHGESGRRQFAFAVNGEKKDEYETAFSKREGARKLPKDLAINQVRSVEESAKAIFPSSLTSHLADVARVGDLVERAEALATDLSVREELTSRDSDADPDTKQRQLAEIADLKDEIGRLRSEIELARVIPLRTNDCDKLLKEAAKRAKQRLIVVSGTVSDRAVSALISDLEDLLASRDVSIWLGFGMMGNDRQSRALQGRANHGPAIRMLEQFAKDHPKQVKVKNLGDSHTKILLCDEDYVALGSYNWLAMKPQGRRHRVEHAFKARNPECIAWAEAECARWFEN